MAWTYSGDPASSARDAVRFAIGDTDTSDQLLNDAEISYITTEYGESWYAFSQAALAVAGKFSRLMSRSIGGLSADFGVKYQHYLELSDKLKASGASLPASPYGSGWKLSEHDVIDSDSDRTPTFASKGVHDNQRGQPADNYAAYDYRRFG